MEAVWSQLSAPSLCSVFLMQEKLWIKRHVEDSHSCRVHIPLQQPPWAPKGSWLWFHKNAAYFSINEETNNLF